MSENEPDEFTKNTEANIQELTNLLQWYKSAKSSQAEKIRLINLQNQVATTIQESVNIVKPRKTIKVSTLLNKAEKFSRKRFYSKDSRYNDKMDKSKSYRIVPPMTFKREATQDKHAKKIITSHFLLSNLQLLENLSNLGRLHGDKSDT